MSAVPSLPELQRAFCAAVLTTDHSLAEWVAGNGLEPEARLQIYRNIVFNNLTAALRIAYPAILKLVGEEFFEGAAARYIRDYPSTSGNLQDYGAHFPEFLARMPEATRLAYLPDVARLEWARQESYLAADATPINPVALTQIPDNRHADLKLILHPSVRLVESKHPIWDIWMFCQQTTPEHLDLSGEGQTVLIWREATQIAMQPLALEQGEFITSLLANESLTKAQAGATAVAPDFDLTACLHDLLQAGLVTDMQTSAKLGK